MKALSRATSASSRSARSRTTSASFGGWLLSQELTRIGQKVQHQRRPLQHLCFNDRFHSSVPKGDRRESNPYLLLHRQACLPRTPRTPSMWAAAIAHWLALPFACLKAAAAGIEPASGRLTAANPYQHGSHRIKPVRTTGFEPAIFRSPT